MNEGINITSAMLDLFKKMFEFWKNKESEVSLWFYQVLCISHGCCPRPKLRNSPVKYISVYKTTTNKYAVLLLLLFLQNNKMKSA